MIKNSQRIGEFDLDGARLGEVRKENRLMQQDLADALSNSESMKSSYRKKYHYSR